MSTNPQWKFQPPMDTSILDFKQPMRTNNVGFQRSNGSYSGGFEPLIKDMANNLFSQSSNFSSSNFNAFGMSNSQTSSPSPVSRFPIGTFTGAEGTDMFNGDSSSNSTFTMSNSSSNNSYNDSSLNNQGTRETGIIEKLLHSYGFIQCCERQARLFFHFSQFGGNIEHLKIGDPVEFEMTYDRRTGKPIASTVSKIAPEVVLSEERVTGTVTTELRIDSSSAGSDTQGRISYENRGECFFLPYTKDDVEGNVTLRTGDKVSFQIATNPRGNLGATHVRLENPAHPVKYQGVVCSMKESFGFIERADVVKEIFFHFSEAKTKDPLLVGDDVEFTIQTRNGKEVACFITKLPPGTVIFEDVADETIKGQVLKPLERGAQRHLSNDPLQGRIRYRARDHSEVEVPFGDKDQQGDFTLRHGDWVEFRIATDRRDQLQRATQISLLLESFEVSGERRERGAIVQLKDNFGFIRCTDRDARLYFHFSELLDVEKEFSVDSEVEFTVVQDAMSNYASQKMSATRIKLLPAGSVVFETIVEKNCEGLVTHEASWTPSKQSNSSSSPDKSEDAVNGQILFMSKDGTNKSVPFSPKTCLNQTLPSLGDNVEFNVAQVKRTKELKAVDVKLKSGGGGVNGIYLPNNSTCPVIPLNNHSQMNNNNINNGSARNGSGAVHRGYVAALKDGYGFIETDTHNSEVFFHYSNFEGDKDCLELGAEVEYTLGARISSGGSCASAENVILLPKGTIAPHVTVGEEIYNGKISRPLRSVNPDQSSYCGLITATTSTEGEDGPTYEFGITGLAYKKELLQVGDAVAFQVDSEGRAVNISAVRDKKKATVDSVKGAFGFLSYEPEEGKKLFFHMSEVKDNVNLQPGDAVEFVVVTNSRNGKSFACNITKTADGGPVAARPERLMLRRSQPAGEETGPKLTVIRQPRGPSEQGFVKTARVLRKPGQLIGAAE